MPSGIPCLGHPPPPPHGFLSLSCFCITRIAIQLNGRHVIPVMVSAEEMFGWLQLSLARSTVCLGAGKGTWADQLIAPGAAFCKGLSLIQKRLFSNVKGICTKNRIPNIASRDSLKVLPLDVFVCLQIMKKTLCVLDKTVMFPLR